MLVDSLSDQPAVLVDSLSDQPAVLVDSLSDHRLGHVKFSLFQRKPMFSLFLS